MYFQIGLGNEDFIPFNIAHYLYLSWNSINRSLLTHTKPRWQKSSPIESDVKKNRTRVIEKLSYILLITHAVGQKI